MQLRTLGGLNLEGVPFTRPKPLLLLAFLSLEGAQERRYLAEFFFPAASRPLQSLASSLTLLRKGAPGSVAGNALRLWTTVTSDAADLLFSLDAGELEQALTLYAGAFLEGFYLRDIGVELEEWIVETREFVAARVRQALLGVAETEATRGAFKEATRYAEQALALPGAALLEPEDLERIHPLLLAGGSLRAAEVEREAAEFDLPLVQSQANARARFHPGSATHRRSALNTLPAMATSYVGREVEGAELKELLAAPECRLLTLTGPGGIGKTRLAVQLARDHLPNDHFADGVFFVPLEAVPSGTALPASIAAALGVELQGSEDPLTQVARFLQGKSALLLLDNFEHLMAATPVVTGLLAASEHLKLLITSRERLNLGQEQAVTVEGLAHAPGAGASVAEQQEQAAVVLFAQRAKRAEHRFSLTPENTPSVLEVCELVNGSPLGIELAAVWVRMMPVAEVAAEIRRNLDFLTTPTRDVAERHHSIRAVFEHSWGLLTAREQLVLRSLAVFHGGFTRAGASEVTGATIPTLASLVDKSLLRVLPSGRFDRHVLLYQFTQEKLAEHPDEQADMQARHGAYYWSYLNRWRKALEGGDQKRALDAIDVELTNIRSAWQWAVQQKRFDELETVLSFAEVFFSGRSRFLEGIDMLRSVTERLDEAVPAHRPALGYALVIHAWFLFYLGRFAEGKVVAEEAVNVLKTIPLDLPLMRGLNVIGALHGWTGGYQTAKEYFVQALTIAQNHNDQHFVPRCLTNLAIVERELGNYAQAEQLLSQSIAMGRRQKDLIIVVSNLNLLAAVLLEQGKLDEAELLLNDGLAIGQETGITLSRPNLLENLANVAAKRRDYPKAQALYQQGLQASRASGSKLPEPGLWTGLGRVALAQDDAPQAKDYLNKALAAGREINSLKSMVAVMMEVAVLRAKQGRPAEAVSLLTMTVSHPAANHQQRREAAELLASWQDGLSAAARKQAQEQGEAWALEDVVQGLLRPGGWLMHEPSGNDPS